MTGKLLAAEYLEQVDTAIEKLHGLLDDIGRARKYLLPSLYGPYAYRYIVEVTDGELKQRFDVVNLGHGITPWEPKVGGRVPTEPYRGWISHWANPDDVWVTYVERVDIPSVISAREMIEKDALTLEGIVDAMTTEDLDTIKLSFETISDAMHALNEVYPSVVAGADHCATVERYVDDNWVSDGARSFRQNVARMENSFRDLREAVEKLVDGNEALMSGLMMLVAAVIEILDLRREELNAAWDNVLDGTLSLLGVLVSPADVLAWVSAALLVADLAGQEDSEDRRQAMDEFQQHSIARDVASAKAAAVVDWPYFGETNVDFQD